MHNELVTTSDSPGPFRPRTVSVAGHDLISVGEMDSERMTDVMHPRKWLDLLRLLQRRGTQKDLQLPDEDEATLITALTGFRKAYLPTAEVIAFVATILSAVRAFFMAKQFGGQDFRRYYHGTAALKKGDELLPLPACLSSLTGTGFTLFGPTQSGKTALLECLADILGKPFELGGPAPAPARMWVIPVLHLTYPTCGTVRGLIRDLREKVLAAIGCEATSSEALSALLRPNAENAAIAVCILMNVGLVTFDGAGTANINRRTEAVLKFLLKLRQSTGMPILISGTSAFMYSASTIGNLSTNLFNGPNLALDPYPAPGDASNEDDVRSCNGLWHQINLFFWLQGLTTRNYPMPPDLPKWTHELTFGRIGWLAQGFESLHLAFSKEKDAPHPEHVTQVAVKKIFRSRLQLHGHVMSALKELQSTRTLNNPRRFVKSLDHLPISALEQPRLCEWLDDYIETRL